MSNDAAQRKQHLIDVHAFPTTFKMQHCQTQRVRKPKTSFTAIRDKKKPKSECSIFVLCTIKSNCSMLLCVEKKQFTAIDKIDKETNDNSMIDNDNDNDNNNKKDDDEELIDQMSSI
jgi:hypothetical protein